MTDPRSLRATKEESPEAAITDHERRYGTASELFDQHTQGYPHSAGIPLCETLGVYDFLTPGFVPHVKFSFSLAIKFTGPKTRCR